MEANSAFLGDAEFRAGNAGTWAQSDALLADCLLRTPADIREVRTRADVRFGFEPVLDVLEQKPAECAVVARLTLALRRVLGGVRYQRLNARWKIGEFEHHLAGWSKDRRCVVARRPVEVNEVECHKRAAPTGRGRRWKKTRMLGRSGLSGAAAASDLASGHVAKPAPMAPDSLRKSRRGILFINYHAAS